MGDVNASIFRTHVLAQAGNPVQLIVSSVVSANGHRALSRVVEAPKNDRALRSAKQRWVVRLARH